MREFDHDYVDEMMRRLSNLRPDTKPLWGQMSAPSMVQHVITAMRYSMGQGGRVPDGSTWFTRNIIRPLLLHGLVGIPRGYRPPQVWETLHLALPGDDTETLHALLEEYLALVQAGELVPPPHPVLGPIGIDGWARLHVMHFEHHMRQFGV